MAERLEAAWRREVKVFGLGFADREAILRVLEDGRAEFGELRGVLLTEHVWRQREGSHRAHQESLWRERRLLGHTPLVGIEASDRKDDQTHVRCRAAFPPERPPPCPPGGPPGSHSRMG